MGILKVLEKNASLRATISSKIVVHQCSGSLKIAAALKATALLPFHLLYHSHAELKVNKQVLVLLPLLSRFTICHLILVLRSK